MSSSGLSDCPRNPDSIRRNRVRKKWSRIRISRQGTRRDYFQSQLRMMMMMNNSDNKVSPKKSQITIASSASCAVSEKNNEKRLIHYQINNTNLRGHGRDKKASGIHDLHEELLAEILVRLPVKYILHCRCVQKSWKTFTQSPMFIRLQLNYQKNTLHYPKYLLFKLQNRFHPLVRYDDSQCQEYCKIQFPSSLPNHAWFAVSYGLLCASSIILTGSDYNRNIYIWNPLINKYKTLPDSPLSSPQNSQAWEALAFGFLPQVNDYVVVHIVKPYLPPNLQSVIIGVYSLNTNSWKKLCQDNVFSTTGSSDSVVFVNGAAFWLGFNSKMKGILMCFDTKTDILCEISLPDWVEHMSLVPYIHPFDQSIAYFVCEHNIKHFDMWVLKYDHMNEFTWEKKMCVRPSEDVLEEVLGLRNNGDPILARSNNLISFNVGSHQANGFVDSWDRWTPGSHYEKDKDYGRPYVIRPFVESLVMLNFD